MSFTFQIYYAVNSLVFPGKISIAALAMFQQTASSLRHAFDRVANQKSNLLEDLHHVEALYNGLKIQNQTPDGELPYPTPESLRNGMAISVR